MSVEHRLVALQELPVAARLAVVPPVQVELLVECDDGRVEGEAKQEIPKRRRAERGRGLEPSAGVVVLRPDCHRRLPAAAQEERQRRILALGHERAQPEAGRHPPPGPRRLLRSVREQVAELEHHRARIRTGREPADDPLEEQRQQQVVAVREVEDVGLRKQRPPVAARERRARSILRCPGERDARLLGCVPERDVARAVGAAVVDDDRPPVRVGLRAQAVQHLVQPRLEVQDGHDHPDERGSGGLRQRRLVFRRLAIATSSQPRPLNPR